MSKNPGEVRISIPKEDAEALMDLVRETKSSRTRIVRLALQVYKQLSDNARGENDEVVIYRDGSPILSLNLPWDEDWAGIPEEVTPGDLAHHGDLGIYYASEIGDVSTKKEESA